MTVLRKQIEVDGQSASYLSAGASGPVVLLLHGTYWSRVWLSALDLLGEAGLRPVAVDLPGCGRSGGELTLETASVPALTSWVTRFLDKLGVGGPLLVGGHDIGGAIAQRLLATKVVEVSRLALVNSVTFDSWPVPGVARFRDPDVVAHTTVDEILELRRRAVTAAIARPVDEAELADYLSPWTELRVARSWMALAGAADSRYTLELLPALGKTLVPKLLVWGENDGFQKISYAERFVQEIPNSRLVRIPNAGHIPMENDPERVSRALAEFFCE